MLGFSIGRVCGNSMLPRIPAGSFILVVKMPRFLLRTGQMYYLNHPRYGRIVKTLDYIDGECLWFRGESKESVSLDAIGAMKQSQLIGWVIAVVKPKKLS